jgi:hypothetical protein
MRDEVLSGEADVGKVAAQRQQPRIGARDRPGKGEGPLRALVPGKGIGRICQRVSR